MSEHQQEKEPKLGLIAVVISTIAAAFGVQSNKNQERDFQKGSLKTFIVSGILFTVIFVLGLIVAVNLVLDSQ